MSVPSRHRAMHFLGNWRTEVYYYPNAVVIDTNGASYVAICQGRLIEPSLDTAGTSWKLLSSPSLDTVASGVPTNPFTIRYATINVTGNSNNGTAALGFPAVGLQIVSVATSPLVITLKPINAAGTEIYDIAVNGYTNIESSTPTPYKITFNKLAASNRFTVAFSQLTLGDGGLQIVPMSNFNANESFSIDVVAYYMTQESFSQANAERLQRMVALASGIPSAGIVINSGVGQYVIDANPSGVYANASSSDTSNSVDAFTAANAGLLGTYQGINQAYQQSGILQQVLDGLLDIPQLLTEFI